MILKSVGVTVTKQIFLKQCMENNPTGIKKVSM